MSRRLQPHVKIGMKRKRSQHRHSEICWTTAVLVCIATLQSMRMIEYGESFVFLTPPSTSPTTGSKYRHNALYQNKARTPSISSNLFARRKVEPWSLTSDTSPQQKAKLQVGPGDIGYKLAMDHELLTKDEELELGFKIRKFIDTKKEIDEIIDAKKVQQRKSENARRREKEAECRKRRQEQSSKNLYEGSLYENVSDDQSLEEELEELLMIKGLNSRPNSRSGFRNSIEDLYGNYEDEDDEEAIMEQLGMAIYGVDTYSNEDSFSDDLLDVDSPEYNYGSYDSNYSSLPETPISSQLTDTLDNIRLLTEHDIKEKLGIDGGRTELAQTLIEGALAKQQMIKSNVRLVTSIAKKWMGTSRGSGLANRKTGEERSIPKTIASGDWSTPGMDEVIQQGIIGLAKAAERFEPELGFKFSTYATFYITSEVRNIFNSATTQCLYVPPYFYTIKNKYQKIVRDHYKKTAGDPQKILSVEAIAQMLDLKLERLEFILKSTQSLVQLDAPIGESTQPGKAGGNDVLDSRTPFIDCLTSDDPTPEAVVEQSLLRQCLENALAAELLPLERDVVRLRHGLDDGQSRTVKEVMESSGGMLTLGDIRTLESRAYQKLKFKHGVHTSRLRDFAADYIGVSPEMLELEMV